MTLRHVLSAARSPIVAICLLRDDMRCSMRSLVMPHSATSSARGDEISITISWKAGVKVSQYCIKSHKLKHVGSQK